MPPEACDAAVDPHVLHLGYKRACERLDADRWERLSLDAFTSLFEALNWAVVIDDSIRMRWVENGRPVGWRWRQRVPNGALMDAVRFARNRVHHQWAAAVSLVHLPLLGPDAPTGLDEPPYAWVWRAVDELPAPSSGDIEKLRPTAREAYEHGQARYAERLAGQPVRVTLAGLNEVFASALTQARFAH